MKAKAIIGFWLMCIACFCGCAAASGNLEDRVNLLEQQNAILTQKLTQSEKKLKAQTETNDKLRTSSAQVNATLDELRAGIQTLTGRMDELDYAMKKGGGSSGGSGADDGGRLSLVEEHSRINRDRIIAIEQYLDMEASASKKSPATAASPPATTQAAIPAPQATTPATPESGTQGLSDADLYAAGKEAFDGGRIEDARVRFQELVTKFPKSSNADNAQFWIGESYYVQGEYKKAIVEYQKVVENFPNGNKVPAALLKQGLAFFNLNENANAKLFLQEMINKYPKSNEAKIARDKLKSF